MPEPADDQLRIFEGASITVTGEVIAKHADLVEEVTFKFFIDGKKKEEKTVPMKEGTKDARSGNVMVEHTLRAAVVPDDQESYTLDYHVFYKVKHKDGTTETQENLAVKKFQVLPRTAQLAVTHVKDGKPLPNFQFKVFQKGQQVGGIQSTFAQDTPNAKGETVPAGTAEFNLGLEPGFRIVQASPYEIAEETTSSGRKRAAKGEPKFRAVFVAPKRGTYKQLVNLESTDEGRGGEGREVTISVAPEGDEDRAVKVASADTAVHFRVSFGPESGEVAKSKRDDAERPTVVTGDKTATIEAKTAHAKYQGKVTLGGGSGHFKVGLGVAGGDTCLVEIAGSDKFLTDAAVPPDQTLTIENWRRVYYELMVPDVMAPRVLTEDESLAGGARKRLEALGQQLFVDFRSDGATVFSAMDSAGDGTLLRASFLELPGPPDGIAYVLTGRNWRDLPDDQAWKETHSGRNLCLAPCDALLKWRKDTAEPQAGTKDYSGTQTTPAGSLDMEATFGGLFMPFSGDDGGDGITDIVWTADVAKTDACAKYMPALELEEDRDVALPSPDTLEVYVAPNAPELVASPASASFQLLPSGKFPAEIGPGDLAKLQDFVDQVLADPLVTQVLGARRPAIVAGPPDGCRGEDACFGAVKSKLTELFDKAKTEVVVHPGLDAHGEPRTGTVSLADISDADKSTTKIWHYRLGEAQTDGTPGPGSFVGASKTAQTCPIKIELSAQPHQAEPGAAQGRLITWVADPSTGARNLVRYVLAGLGAIKDKAAIAHGHGADGKPGDCLAEADVLCAACVAFGRSVSLELIP